MVGGGTFGVTLKPEWWPNDIDFISPNKRRTVGKIKIKFIELFIFIVCNLSPFFASSLFVGKYRLYLSCIFLLSFVVNQLFS